MDLYLYTVVKFDCVKYSRHVTLDLMTKKYTILTDRPSSVCCLLKLIMGLNPLDLGKKRRVATPRAFLSVTIFFDVVCK